MPGIECWVKPLVVVLFLIFNCNADGEFISGTKQKRGGNMGLFPFPRVGRAGNEIAWPNGYPDLNIMHQLKTRKGLMPFPRVGRTDPNQQYSDQTLPGWVFRDDLEELQKRNGGNGANGGLWFGPRLGRLQKRTHADYSDGDDPWTFVALKSSDVVIIPIDNKQLEPGLNKFTPRLGRESEEEQENEDTIVEEVLSSRRVDAKNRNNLTQQ